MNVMYHARSCVTKWGGEHEDSYRRVRALSDAIVGGAFDDALLEAFGDHAEVRYHRGAFVVSEYSHD